MVEHEGETDPRSKDPGNRIIPTHLIVIAHGMWGTVRDVKYLSTTLSTRLQDRAVVMVSEANQLLLTYHGIDVCGARLVAEVKAYIEAYQARTRTVVTKISFVGYSAGGLFIRYAAGLMQQEGFFERVKPVTFITVATPHLGCRDLPHSFSGRLRNGLMSAMSNFYSGRSGQQMMLVDNHDHPLLLEMSLPWSPYAEALRRFERVFFYANANRDNTVNYCTAAIAQSNPYRGLKQPPPSTLGDRWRHVIAERSVSVDEITQTVRDSAKAELSRYDTNLNPVALGLLSPLLLTHAVLLMTPLRLTASLSGDQSHRWQRFLPPPLSSATESLATATANAGSVCLPSSMDAILSAATSRPVSSSAQDAPTEWTPPSIDHAGEVVIPPEGATEAQEEGDVRSAEDVGHRSETPEEKRALDELACAIRENLIKLPITRVDVFLPGMHTHGMIIYRREWDHLGAEIVEHVATKLIDGV